MKKLLFLLFLIPSLCFGGPLQRGHLAVIAGSMVASCSPTAEITQSVGGEEAAIGDYSYGQTFTLADTDIYSIVVYNYSGSGNLTMYLDTDTDLSDTSFDPVGPVDCSSGSCEFVFNLTGLSPGTYCFAIPRATGAPAIERAFTDEYAGGHAWYATNGLNLTGSLASHEIKFAVNTCSGY